jgi:hypothetical protein
VKELEKNNIHYDFLQANNEQMPDIVINFKPMFFKGSVEKLHNLTMQGLDFKVGYCLQSQQYCTYEKNSAIALSSGDTLSTCMSNLGKACANKKFFTEISQFLLTEYKTNKDLQLKYKESILKIKQRVII